MQKSPDAFRTISEVADWVGVPTHVLRFWESRFAQVKPVKRAGGRRYYRPSDMLLIGGIKRLLHDDGMTIRGVQKLLREEGIRRVQSHSRPLEEEAPVLMAVGDAQYRGLSRDGAQDRPHEVVPQEDGRSGGRSRAGIGISRVRSRRVKVRTPQDSREAWRTTLLLRSDRAGTGILTCRSCARRPVPGPAGPLRGMRPPRPTQAVRQ